MDKIEKAYIELEMSRYEFYKNEIQLERERILSSSYSVRDGMPRGYGIGKPTESKAIKLMESTAILSMQRVVDSVDRVLSRCDNNRKTVFYEYYVKGERNNYKICEELFISVETFRRYRRELIESVGVEMGAIKYQFNGKNRVYF